MQMSAEITYPFPNKAAPTRQANDLHPDRAGILTGYLLMSLSAVTSCWVYTKMFYELRGLFF
jgi:hypothetical protein